MCVCARARVCVCVCVCVCPYLGAGTVGCESAAERARGASKGRSLGVLRIVFARPQTEAEAFVVFDTHVPSCPCNLCNLLCCLTRSHDMGLKSHHAVPSISLKNSGGGQSG